MDQINEFMATMPGWLAAILTAIVAILFALAVQAFVRTLVNKTRFGAKAMTTGGNIGSALGKAAFWLTLVFFIPPVLGFLNLAEYAQPIDDLFRNIATFLPNLFGAALVFGLGFIIARIAQNATQYTLSALQIDNIATKLGIKETTGSTGSIAKALGALVFILFIVPVTVAALDILKIEGVSEPLVAMLDSFIGYIDEIVAGSLVLGISIFIGRYAANFLKGFLPTLGFDSSVNTLMAIDDGEGLRFSPSAIAGNLAFLIIVVLGLTAALEILGIDFLSETFDDIVVFGGQLLRAAVLIMIGVFLANFISRIMAGMISPRIAEFFRYVAILIFVFLGLSSLDPNGDIIPIAFGALVIGAAVAGSLAFGIGGREWAGQVLAKLFPPKDMGGTPAKKPVTRRTAPKK